MDGEAKKRKDTEQLAAKYQGDDGALIQLLLDIQTESRWLSSEDLSAVSSQLRVPIARVYHIATFYKAFSLKPRGKHSLCVCMGTACHVRGAPALLDQMQERLGIREGQTTRDGKYTLNTVNCMGCCALGPVLSVDEEYHSNPQAEQLDKIL